MDIFLIFKRVNTEGMKEGKNVHLEKNEVKRENDRRELYISIY